MSQAILAWASLKNMLRQAARDPLWAFLALISAPFRYGATVFKVSIFYLIVVVIVAAILQYAVQAIGAERGGVIWMVANLALIAFALLFIFRLITNPLIIHFGDMADDTHGSARFATAEEIAPLARSETGLLIGRDGKTGKLLRYDGPSHLLTMAPTRTGKGVGTIIPNLLTADRSIICIDPKGENARIASRARIFGSLVCLVSDAAMALQSMHIARKERLYATWFLMAFYIPTAAIFALRAWSGHFWPVSSQGVLGPNAARYAWFALSAVVFVILRSIAVVLIAAERSQKEFFELAHRDPLTGAFNRAGLAKAHAVAIKAGHALLLVRRFLGLNHIRPRLACRTMCAPRGVH